MEWLYWYGDGWTVDERPLLSMRENSFWMGNSVFDGARAYDGFVPDLDEHCRRLGTSAEVMLMKPTMTAGELASVCLDGIRRFEAGAHLYIRPMYFARGGFIVPDATTTECAIAIHRAPMPPLDGFTATVSRFRRPSPDAAPTAAKASCLYPMTQRIIQDAMTMGFDTALVRTPTGYVAEFATANVMTVSGGIVRTPRPDGSFLAGITRRRVMSLLAADGINVVETDMTVDDVRGADEAFSVGNYGKIVALRRLDDIHYPVGPVALHAASRYAEFARSQPA
jgi:branched-chain amino acid aminotransferase